MEFVGILTKNMRTSFITGTLVFIVGLELGVGHIRKLVDHNESNQGDRVLNFV